MRTHAPSYCRYHTLSNRWRHTRASSRDARRAFSKPDNEFNGTKSPAQHLPGQSLLHCISLLIPLLNLPCLTKA